MTGHVDPTKEAFAAFRANDRPGPIHMLNLGRVLNFSLDTGLEQ